MPLCEDDSAKLEAGLAALYTGAVLYTGVLLWTSGLLYTGPVSKSSVLDLSILGRRALRSGNNFCSSGGLVETLFISDWFGSMVNMGLESLFKT